MNWQASSSRRVFLKGLAGTIALFSTYGTREKSHAAPARSPTPEKAHLGDIDRNTIFDVCVIGSGIAGAVLANSLVKQGITTVVLESGSAVDAESRDPRLQELEVYRSSGPINYPAVVSRFRGVGGTSWLWGGYCTRLQPFDLQRNSYTPPGAGWPISYADLEPYYERAEETLRVRGGKQSQYHPPMRKSFPRSPDRDHARLTSLFAAAGITMSDPPRSTSDSRQGRYGGYGPALRMAESHLPEFQKSRHGTLVAEASVTRLMVGSDGSVVGAEVTDLDRNPRIIHARIYVIACGGLESPRLLLLSRARGFPNGIGNNDGLVGRYFMEHRSIDVEAKIPQSDIGWLNFNLYHMRGRSFQFYREFKENGLGGIILNAGLEGISRSDVLSFQFRRLLENAWSQRVRIEFEFEMEPRPENRVSLDREVKDYFGNPVANLYLSESKKDLKTIELGKRKVREILAKLRASDVNELPGSWGHHHMGTCRMGDNPRTSVVNRDLRVHGLKNLFVAGSSVFVTCGVSNPTLTLTALSVRLADHLRSQFRQGSLLPESVLRRSVLKSV